MSSCSSMLVALVVASTFFLGSSRTSKFSFTVIVDKSGNGNFTTIQDAINFVPNGNNKWCHIVVNPGIYTEKVNISSEKEYIFLEGSGYSRTIISWDDHQTTNTSSTFSSYPNNFVANNISFMNSYNLRQFTHIKQALAAQVYGDKVAFYNCGFYGMQDTLFDGRGRHYYNSCYIEGGIDFIWGYGQSVFEGCEINAKANQLRDGIGYITAQGRESGQDKNGFVFLRGIIYGNGTVYLGRAYGRFSRVIFSEMSLSSVVHPSGWDAWNFGGQEGSFTNVEAGCIGPGANTGQRAFWTKVENTDSVDLQQFTVENFIDQDGWIANTRFE